MAQYRASGGVWVLVEVVGSLVGWRLPGAWPVRAVLSGAGVRVVLSAWPAPVVAGCRVPGACATRSCAARSSGLTRTSCSVPGAGGTHVVRGCREGVERHGGGHVARCVIVVRLVAGPGLPRRQARRGLA